jgi:mannose-6-phosphate isomerase-like protein (cupin superfamily)
MDIQLIEQSGLPNGTFEGHLFGAGISMFLEHDIPEGAGPKLHQHPYDETFIVQAGSARFTVGEERMVLSAGQMVVVPANVPHKFESLGGYGAIHIHASERFITDWLE